MKPKKAPFICVYLIYLLLLTSAVIACIIYVNDILRQYEDNLPERHVESAVAELVADAEEGRFWDKYDLPEFEPGRFEENVPLSSAYLAKYGGDTPKFSQKGGGYEEDALYYAVENNGTLLAEVKLRAAGPSVTKLSILNFREWELEYVRPVVEKSDYTISVPVDFDVNVNGIALHSDDGVTNGREITYTVKGVYLEPTFDIRDGDGQTVSYQVKDKRVLAEFYYYTLTLPAALKVELDGAVCQGEALTGNRTRYEVRRLTKPEINISDDYGNVVAYEGGIEIPLTYLTIKTDAGCSVNVSGIDVPGRAVSGFANPEYAFLADYVENLPDVSEYEIAILERDPEIEILDESGRPVIFDPDATELDLTAWGRGLDGVPDSVSAELDVLDVAQTWSLFMSNDAPFSEISKYILPNSYQYKVAVKYATGIDITFTSNHTLMDPAFTDGSVTNFVWVTDDCFSVDIRFVKHMLLQTGQPVDDFMNDRFYFVRYDAAKGSAEDPTWKIVGMKEILDNAQKN